MNIAVLCGYWYLDAHYRCTVYWNRYSFLSCSVDDGDIPNKYVVSTPALLVCPGYYYLDV